MKAFNMHAQLYNMWGQNNRIITVFFLLLLVMLI